MLPNWFARPIFRQEKCRTCGICSSSSSGSTPHHTFHFAEQIITLGNPEENHQNGAHVTTDINTEMRELSPILVLFLVEIFRKVRIFEGFSSPVLMGSVCFAYSRFKVIVSSIHWLEKMFWQWRRARAKSFSPQEKLLPKIIHDKFFFAHLFISYYCLLPL